MSNKSQMYSGYHAVEAMLRHRPQDILELFVQDSRAERGDERLEKLCQEASRLGVRSQRARREVLEKHVGPQHQGVVASARGRKIGDDNALRTHLENLDNTPLLLILDGVTDPHNLGACLRSADASGVDAVVVPRRHACGLTPVVCRTAVGAAESVPYFEVGNLVRAMGALKEKGFWLAGTALAENSQSLFAFEANDVPLAIVMGAEGDGMRLSTQQACDYLLAIPMAGEVQSLNVSVATAVVLFHLARVRGLA